MAHTTLANERNLIGGMGGGVTVAQLAQLARAAGRVDDPLIRQGIAEFYTRTNCCAS